MSKEKIKIEELRLLFDRENSRKQNLENKASYFLGCISIIITLVCSFSESILNNLFSILGFALIISFIISLIFCISIFRPKEYYHPFIIGDYKKLENSFKEEIIDFEETLIKQYLISIYENYNLNNKLANKFKYSIIAFGFCLIIFIIMEVFL